MDTKAWNLAQEAFRIEADSLLATAEKIQREAFGQAVDALATAPRIAASGCGHSGIACRHFAHLMCCIERPARFLSPAEATHGGTGFLQRGDVLLLASRGGKTAELLPVLRIGREKGCTVIGVTENMASPLAVDTDLVIPMHEGRETDKYNAQGTTSFSVLSAIFDALQAAVMEETGYAGEQFALIHPGGAVGERLNREKTETNGGNMQ